MQPLGTPTSPDATTVMPLLVLVAPVPPCGAQNRRTGLAAGPPSDWRVLAQVAEQLSVGRVLVPLKPAWSPQVVLPPAAITLL